MVPASTTTNSAAAATAPNSTNTPLASSTNTRSGSGGDGGLLNRSAPDRQTIHSTYPSRQHATASTRNSNNSTTDFSDGNTRYQQQAGATSSMIGGTGNGAQSFLSKLSSKFARR